MYFALYFHADFIHFRPLAWCQPLMALIWKNLEVHAGNNVRSPTWTSRRITMGYHYLSILGVNKSKWQRSKIMWKQWKKPHLVIAIVLEAFVLNVIGPRRLEDNIPFTRRETYCLPWWIVSLDKSVWSSHNGQSWLRSQFRFGTCRWS